VTRTQAGADVDRCPQGKDIRPVAMVAEMVDAVIGVDTHREFNQVEIARPSGAVIATGTFTNDSPGHAEALAWMVEHAPGPRLVISIEGTRSYGAGLARAAATAGLAVIEAEQPTRTHRRGKDTSDRIDAHLAVLYALGLDATKLPTPRSDGDREALRILLCARQQLTTTTTGQTNRLRALLRDGDDTDRQLARARLTDTVVASLARRHLPAHASHQQAIHQGEIRRLALALHQAAQALTTNRAELAAIVHDLAPDCSANPESARSAPPKPSCRFPTLDAVAVTPPSPSSRAPAQSRPPAAKPPATGSIGVGTGR
jgi:transposase